jgi:hypothetical protein
MGFIRVHSQNSWFKYAGLDVRVARAHSFFQQIRLSKSWNPRRLSSSIHLPAKRKNGAGLGFSQSSIHDAPKAQLLGHHSLIHDFYTRNALSHPHPEVPGISRKKVVAISGNRGIENWPVFFCKFQRR